MIHRYVYKPIGAIIQIGGMLFVPPFPPASVCPDGVPMPGTRDSRVLDPNGFHALVVDDFSLDPLLKRLDDAAMDVALSETTGIVRQYAGDSGSVSAFVFHAYKLVGYASAHRINGPFLLVTCNGGRPDPRQCLFMPKFEGMKAPVVNVVWVAEKFRRRGLSRDLLTILAGYFRLPLQGVCYSAPFTEAGFQLVRQLAGEKFVVYLPQMVSLRLSLDEEDKFATCHHRGILARPPDELSDPFRQLGLKVDRSIAQSVPLSTEYQLPRATERSKAKANTRPSSNTRTKKPKRLFKRPKS
jgi:hypothetical protein